MIYMSLSSLVAVAPCCADASDPSIFAKSKRKKMQLSFHFWFSNRHAMKLLQIFYGFNCIDAHSNCLIENRACLPLSVLSASPCCDISVFAAIDSNALFISAVANFKSGIKNSVLLKIYWKRWKLKRLKLSTFMNTTIAYLEIMMICSNFSTNRITVFEKSSFIEHRVHFEVRLGKT